VSTETYLADFLKTLTAEFGASRRERAVELTRYEARELENVFMLLLLGSLAGIPGPPCWIAMDLLPHLQHEIEVLNSSAERSGDALAELAGILNFG